VNIPILFEDEFIVVVDKPPFVVVNRAESVKEETIQEWAEKKFEIRNSKFEIEKESDFWKRGGVVHRIDKETSGVLILAKNEEAFDNLQRQFKAREVKKKYTGLVPWNREQFGVIAGGREAVTHFKLLMNFKSDGGSAYSLVWAFPKTGRTHQIRVHMKYMGYPLVSDKLYGGRKTYKEDIKFCPRLFLHASYIEFRHPVKEEMMKVESKLPADLEDALGKLVRMVES